MKKVLALLLALVLVLSLAACGEGSNSGESSGKLQDENINEFLLGKWEHSYVAEKTDTFGRYAEGDELVITIEFFEGGVWRNEIYDKTKNTSVNYRGSWFFEDGFIKRKSSEGEDWDVLKPDYDINTLTDVTDKSVVYSKK